MRGFTAGRPASSHMGSSAAASGGSASGRKGSASGRWQRQHGQVSWPWLNQVNRHVSWKAWPQVVVNTAPVSSEVRQIEHDGGAAAGGGEGWEWVRRRLWREAGDATLRDIGCDEVPVGLEGERGRGGVVGSWVAALQGRSALAGRSVGGRGKKAQSSHEAWRSAATARGEEVGWLHAGRGLRAPTVEWVPAEGRAGAVDRAQAGPEWEEEGEEAAA